MQAQRTTNLLTLGGLALSAAWLLVWVSGLLAAHQSFLWRLAAPAVGLVLCAGPAAWLLIRSRKNDQALTRMALELR